MDNPPARRIRNIRQQESTSSSSGEHNNTIEQAQETLDPERTYYIQEIIDSWNQVNHVKPSAFMNRNPSGIDASLNNEIWIKTKSNNINIEWIADTGSPKSFINEATANNILQKCNKATRLPYNQDPEKYRCFNKVSIPISAILQLDLTSGDWTSRNNKILIVKTQTVNLLGRDVLSKFRFALSQKQGKQINQISTELSFKTKVLEQFPHLCTRKGKSKIHIAKSDIKDNIFPTQHKGRRVPLHLTDKVDKEIKHLLDTGQIIKLDKCSDDVFISPIVITVKHDKSIKLALDSQLLNDAINKNKYQMQSIDNLMDAVEKYLSDNKHIPGEFLFSKIDLKYAYSQIPLHPTIQKHCNFNILGGKSTGTYRFVNGFYGLSDMPATFQKTIDKTLKNIPNKFNLLDDILKITKGTIADHESDIKLILKRLDHENLAIKLEKCEFAKLNITWLGYNITQSGTSPNNKKTDSIKSLEPPKTLKQLRSLTGSIHQLIKFIPNLASLLDPIRPLLKKENITNNKIQWSNEHTDALNNIKNKISEISEQKNFDKEKPTRVKCDASHKGLGATLEQWDNNGCPRIRQEIFKHI